jgi:hypothetical protein
MGRREKKKISKVSKKLTKMLTPSLNPALEISESPFGRRAGIGFPVRASPTSSTAA